MANNSNKDADEIPRTRKETRPDFANQPIPAAKLPKEIQSTLDDDEKLWETLSEGKGKDSTETSTRYAAYAARVRTILVSAQRYVAYTSDIGESFRPIAHPYLVRGAYAVSWLYLTGDVAHEGYKAYLRNQATRRELDPSLADDKHSQIAAAAQTEQQHENLAKKAGQVSQVAAAASSDLIRPLPSVPVLEDYRTVMVQRALFQGIASMGLPAFTIHSIVRYSGRALKNSANKTMRTWAPIGLGLAAVPALPYMFDEPVEKGLEWVFHSGAKALGKDVSSEKKDL